MAVCLVCGGLESCCCTLDGGKCLSLAMPARGSKRARRSLRRCRWVWRNGVHGEDSCREWEIIRSHGLACPSSRSRRNLSRDTGRAPLSPKSLRSLQLSLLARNIGLELSNGGVVGRSRWLLDGYGGTGIRNLGSRERGGEGVHVGLCGWQYGIPFCSGLALPG